MSRNSQTKWSSSRSGLGPDIVNGICGRIAASGRESAKRVFQSLRSILERYGVSTATDLDSIQWRPCVTLVEVKPLSRNGS